MITSSQNKLVKEIKSLSKKRERAKTGLFIAEGLRFVQAALDAGADVRTVLYSTAIFRTDEGAAFVQALEKEDGLSLYEIDEKIMAEISDTQSPQGILALVKQPEWQWSDLVKDSGFVMILDRLQDPGNLGTIIRTADAAGADGVVLLKGSVDAYNPKVLRSTMGSVFKLPVLEGVVWQDVKEKLKDKSFTLNATALENSVVYDSLDYRGATAMVIGNEANGISDEILEEADNRVIIPIVGSAESLNAGVAAAVMMYEVLRQRRNTIN